MDNTDRLFVIDSSIDSLDTDSDDTFDDDDDIYENNEIRETPEYIEQTYTEIYDSNGKDDEEEPLIKIKTLSMPKVSVITIEKTNLQKTIDELSNIALSLNTANEEINKVSCIKCHKTFEFQYQLDDHKSVHENQIENNVCMCNKCGGIFESDTDFLAHKSNCSQVNNNSVPMDEEGKYICPICNKKYSNTFILGEHFINSHNDYNELCILDEKSEGPLGFPGFELLQMIGMIEIYIESLETEDKLCKICYHYFDFNIFIDELDSENRNSLVLKCCNKLICYSCLLHQLSINNNLVCPFCLFDHTRTDLNYIVEIVESEVTDKNRWLSWWFKHVDIFY